MFARRKFIQSSLMFSATAFLLSRNTPLGFAKTLIDDDQLPDAVLGDPVYSFTRETFEPYIGGYFQAPDARGRMVALKLVKVNAFRPKTGTRVFKPKTETRIFKRTVETESFSLLFQAESPLPESKSIHRIRHGALGDFNLFVSRHDGSSREICYEAVFNRLR